MRRIFAAATAILVLAVGASFSTASAAHLPVFAAMQTTQSNAQACASAVSGGQPVVDSTAGGVGTNGSYTQVTLSSIPASCLGQSLVAYVHNASGGVIVSGSGTVTAGTVTVTVPSYAASTVSTVVTKIGGWIFPTDWAAPVVTPGLSAICEAVNPGGQVRDTATCAVTVSPNGNAPWQHGGYRMWNFTFNVVWTVPPPNSNWTWRVTFDLSRPPFPGFTPRCVGTNSNPGIALAPGYACSQLPALSMQSTSQNVWGGTLEISDGPAPGYFNGQNFCN